MAGATALTAGFGAAFDPDFDAALGADRAARDGVACFAVGRFVGFASFAAVAPDDAAGFPADFAFVAGRTAGRAADRVAAALFPCPATFTALDAGPADRFVATRGDALAAVLAVGFGDPAARRAVEPPAGTAAPDFAALRAFFVGAAAGGLGAFPAARPRSPPRAAGRPAGLDGAAEDVAGAPRRRPRPAVMPTSGATTSRASLFFATRPVGASTGAACFVPFLVPATRSPASSSDDELTVPADPKISRNRGGCQ